MKSLHRLNSHQQKTWSAQSTKPVKRAVWEEAAAAAVVAARRTVTTSWSHCFSAALSSHSPSEPSPSSPEKLWSSQSWLSLWPQSSASRSWSRPDTTMKAHMKWSSQADTLAADGDATSTTKTCLTRASIKSTLAEPKHAYLRQSQIKSNLSILSYANDWIAFKA